MFSKVYENIKAFIKECYKEMIFFAMLLVIFTVPLNYTIMVSGGTININDRVKIEDSYNSKGSFNMAYVSEIKGTAPNLLLSYIIPSWTKVPIEEYQASSKETSSDILKRAKVYLEYSKQAAIINAYKKAGKTFIKKGLEFYVVYISEESETDLKIGDKLLKANNIKIESVDDYKKIIDEASIGDYINLLVDRDGKEKKLKIKVKEIDGEKMSGVTILQLFDYVTDPKIKLSFKGNESGSSGGLMLTLAIYDKLIKEDLTKGRKIVGTGTINYEGEIGPIDGVEYKLRGAVKDKADIFIAPTGDNYKKCIELKKKNNYKIKIIEAKSFEGVIEELSK